MPKKSKRNWKHIHKIKVHHNRWLMWAISAAIIVAAALIAYIQVSNIYFESNIFGQPVTGSWTNFTNRVYGYSLKYPKNWAIEAETASSMSFESVSDPNESVSVTIYPGANEKDLRAALFTTKETATEVAGLKAVKVSRNKNQAESVVMFKAGAELYVIRGQSSSFDKIVESFRFQQKIE
jgi:hypothetical protein